MVRTAGPPAQESLPRPALCGITQSPCHYTALTAYLFNMYSARDKLTQIVGSEAVRCLRTSLSYGRMDV